MVKGISVSLRGVQFKMGMKLKEARDLTEETNAFDRVRTYIVSAEEGVIMDSTITLRFKDDKLVQIATGLEDINELRLEIDEISRVVQSGDLLSKEYLKTVLGRELKSERQLYQCGDDSQYRSNDSLDDEPTKDLEHCERFDNDCRHCAFRSGKYSTYTLISIEGDYTVLLYGEKERLGSTKIEYTRAAIYALTDSECEEFMAKLCGNQIEV